MYCVIAKPVGAADGLYEITTYGPFISELLAQTFAKKRLQSEKVAWRVVRLTPDAPVDITVFKRRLGAQYSNCVKVSFPEK